jgi:DNA invertase Pin-like site-specific DNA recombinase
LKEILHIYTRVSSKIQFSSGTSITTQTDIGVELASKLGMSYKIHNEGGKSSAKDDLSNRPVMNNLLKQMDYGTVKHLYVFTMDRLSRNQITWYSIRQKMVKNSVTLYTPKGVHDTKDSLENMILGILSEIAQYDNNLRSSRSRLGKLEKVKQNYWRGGPPTFGYMIQKETKGSIIVENPDESQWVKYIFSTYNNKIPLSKIKLHLEANNVLTRRGNSHWNLGSLQSMIRNNSYLGTDTYTDKKTGETIRTTIPQLISNHTFQEAQRIRTLKLTRNNFTSTKARTDLLRPYLICSGCNIQMNSRNGKTDQEPMYYCTLTERRFNNSNLAIKECYVKKSINISATDKQVTKVILDTLSSPKQIKGLMMKKNLLGLNFTTDEISAYKSGKESILNNLTNERANIESALTKLETKQLLGEFANDTIYHNTKKSLLKKLDQCRLSQEKLSSELDKIDNKEQWLTWLDRCAELINDARCNNGAELVNGVADAGLEEDKADEKDTVDLAEDKDKLGEWTGTATNGGIGKDASDVADMERAGYTDGVEDVVSPNGSEVVGDATNGKGLRHGKLKALLSNVLDSVHVDYDHKEKLHHLDIKLRLPITKDPNSIFDKNSNSGNNIRSINGSENQPSNLHRGVSNYSTVTDLAKFRG